jgi:AraC-like DNA-binding protein
LKIRASVARIYAGVVPAGLPPDTRGIVDPAAMFRLVRFERYPPGETLAGVVAWFWSVAWDLPAGQTHDQQVLNHPSGHLSIGTLDDTGVPLDPAQGRVYGVRTGVSHRLLTGRGWTVAARTTVGGLGVLLGAPAQLASDAQLGFDVVIPGPTGERLVREVAELEDDAERADRLRAALEAVLEGRSDAQIAEARRVAGIADLAERDRTVCRTEQLAAAAGLSVRSLQRLFASHVGASPAFVIRRWRLIEAAEAASQAVAAGEEDGWRGWATVAADLGYADQAHLTRDFRHHLGTSPSAYLAQVRSQPAPS